MRKLVFTLLASVVSLVASAQVYPTWSLEIGAGVGGHIGAGRQEANMRFSHVATLYADLPLTPYWSFQTGLGWQQVGVTRIQKTDLKVSKHYLQVPLMGAYHIGTPSGNDITLSAGPYLSFGVGGKYTAKSGDLTTTSSAFKTTAIGEKYRRFDYGIRLAGKIEIDHWLIGLTTDFGLRSVQSSRSARNFGAYVTVGHRF